MSGKTLFLNGPATAKFILNITGKFALTGGGKIKVSGGALASNVLYNFIGTGSAVSFSGGGNSSQVDGTILAPQRKVQCAPGLVNGAIISGMDISLVSGAALRNPPGMQLIINTLTVDADSPCGPLGTDSSATVECAP